MRRHWWHNVRVDREWVRANGFEWLLVSDGTLRPRRPWRLPLSRRHVVGDRRGDQGQCRRRLPHRAGPARGADSDVSVPDQPQDPGADRPGIGRPARARGARQRPARPDHNPYVMAHLPPGPAHRRAEQRLLVVQHPPLAGDGTPFYDSRRIGRMPTTRSGARCCGRRSALRCAPSSIASRTPKLVRGTGTTWSTRRSGERAQRPLDRPVIGRHSRPDRRKWPDTARRRSRPIRTIRASPSRCWAAAPFLFDLLGGYPRNWMVWRFDAFPPERFLSKIDFFVYYHSSQWVEAFGCTIAEAMASGAVAILPPHFEALFGDGALCRAARGRRAGARSPCRPRGLRRQSERGRGAGRGALQPGGPSAPDRDLIGPPAPEARAGASVPRAASAPAVLFIASNGVGIGHLTRLLAIARRCPPSLQPVFATMSQASGSCARRATWPSTCPITACSAATSSAGTSICAQELDELIAFYDPPVVVFDGNVPYQGLIDAIARQSGGVVRSGVGAACGSRSRPGGDRA